MGFQSHNGLPFEQDIPGHGLHDAHDGFHGGRFTGTVRTDKGNDFAFRNGKVDAFQGFNVAISGFYVFQFKQHQSSSFPR